MPVGRFLLCLHSHMPYVLSHGKSPHGTDWLNESAAECYLPLLDALDRLLRQGIRPRWTVNISPILAEQLDDPGFKDGFVGYCDEKIAASRSDLDRFRREGPLFLEGLSAMWDRWYTRAVDQFRYRWGRSLCEAFRHFQDEGSIEIITCAATHGYLPLLSTEESVRAQIRIGKQTYEARFGRSPRGIWLPECAYRPRYEWRNPADEHEQAWPRRGVDEFLAEEGIEYFFVDSHMIRGGQPLGTYGAQFPQLAELFARSSKMFTPPEEQRSEYEHYALPTGVTVFARDPVTTVRVWSGEVGYPGDPSYLEFHKQLYPGRLRYWRISENKQDLGAKRPYSPWDAFDRIATHANDFVDLVANTLARYRGEANRMGTLVAMYDTELFGHWWWEGPEFLYEAARAMHHRSDVEMVSGSDVLDCEPARHSIHLPEGSWGEGGYHHIWINQDNFWTWQKLTSIQRKMREMARAYRDGLARELTQQAARELLLAEASDWQFLISTWAARDYAEIRFADHVERFERIAALAEKVHAGGELTDDERLFIEDCREKDAAFPTIDPDLWLPAERNGPSGASL